MKSYGKLTVGLLAAWFVGVLAAGAAGVFRNDANRIGVEVAVAALAPIIVFAVWYAASEGFRRFVLGLDPAVLTAAQSWRVLGITFVVLEAKGLLPGLFALPAGYGDIFIGATAALVAWKLAKPEHKATFLAWQALGMADLVTAVSLGTTARLIDPQGVSMLPMTVLPLSLVPTFLVPLFFILHVIVIAQARRWRAGEQSRILGAVA